MIAVKILILWTRLYYIDKRINSNEKQYKQLQRKEMLLENKLKSYRRNKNG